MADQVYEDELSYMIDLEYDICCRLGAAQNQLIMIENRLRDVSVRLRRAENNRRSTHSLQLQREVWQGVRALYVEYLELANNIHLQILMYILFLEGAI